MCSVPSVTLRSWSSGMVAASCSRWAVSALAPNDRIVGVSRNSPVSSTFSSRPSSTRVQITRCAVLLPTPTRRASWLTPSWVLCLPNSRRIRAAVATLERRSAPRLSARAHRSTLLQCGFEAFLGRGPRRRNHPARGQLADQEPGGAVEAEPHGHRQLVDQSSGAWVCVAQPGDLPRGRRVPVGQCDPGVRRVVAAQATAHVDGEVVDRSAMPSARRTARGSSSSRIPRSGSTDGS